MTEQLPSVDAAGVLAKLLEDPHWYDLLILRKRCKHLRTYMVGGVKEDPLDRGVRVWCPDCEREV